MNIIVAISKNKDGNMLISDDVVNRQIQSNRISFLAKNKIMLDVKTIQNKEDGNYIFPFPKTLENGRYKCKLNLSLKSVDGHGLMNPEELSRVELSSKIKFKLR